MSEGAEVETPKETRPLSTNRTEPIKITMWSGKAGVGARPKSPSPSPLTQSQEHQFETGTVGDVPLPAEKMAKLNADAEEFRERQMVINEQKRTEARQWAARALLMKLDEEDGKKVSVKQVMKLGLIAPVHTLPPAEISIRTVPPPIHHPSRPNPNNAIQAAGPYLSR